MTSEKDPVDWGNLSHPEMNATWSHLPLVPLELVLQHLSPEDALRATAVCRHWRTALLHYHGYRETIKLRVSDEVERNLLISRIFRKNARKLRIVLDGSQRQLHTLLTHVLPLFFDSSKLREVFFVGPVMSECDEIQINRKAVNKLVFKHIRSLQKVALVGFTFDAPKTDRYASERMECYPHPMLLSHDLLQAGAALQHIIADYDHLSTSSLKTLSRLPNFSRLTVVVSGVKQPALKPVDWPAVNTSYPKPLQVALVAIDLTEEQMEDVTQNVLVDGLNLISLKMLFNKNLYCPILYHVADHYGHSICEVVWVDAPQSKHEKPVVEGRIYYENSYREQLIACDMNPFIIMCWQCRYLRRIVIHGYWTWQYDIVGFFRMRPTLERVEISAMKAGPSPRHASKARLREGDLPARITNKLVKKINEYTANKWSPIGWDKLHPGLRAGSTDQDKIDYIIEETSDFIRMK